MNTSKHTPGPWKAFNSKNGRIFKHWQIDTGTGSVTLDDATHWEAGNAHLIAAAPAMYEALKEWCDYYAAYNPVRDKRIEPFIKLTRQALAQAEGR